MQQKSRDIVKYYGTTLGVKKYTFDFKELFISEILPQL
jgi:hypothetical protein